MGDGQGQGWQEGTLQNRKGKIKAWSAALLLTHSELQLGGLGGRGECGLFQSFTAHTSRTSARGQETAFINFPNPGSFLQSLPPAGMWDSVQPS